MYTLWQAHNTQQSTLEDLEDLGDYSVPPLGQKIAGPSYVVKNSTNEINLGHYIGFHSPDNFARSSISSSSQSAMTFSGIAGDGNTYTFINGDVISDTINGSQTITHKTEYVGVLEPGKFCESIGEIYYMPPRENKDGEPIEWCAYEDCIAKIKQSETLNNKILGIVTYNNSDNMMCRFATHGDVLVKVIPGTYAIGDVLIPALGGFAKKGTSEEILNCITLGIPRIKITATHTKEPNTIAGMIL